jgi:hypothetical protein
VDDEGDKEETKEGVFSMFIGEQPWSLVINSKGNRNRGSFAILYRTSHGCCCMSPFFYMGFRPQTKTSITAGGGACR